MKLLTVTIATIGLAACGPLTPGGPGVHLDVVPVAQQDAAPAPAPDEPCGSTNTDPAGDNCGPCDPTNTDPYGNRCDPAGEPEPSTESNTNPGGG
jgi:hypothetical protein